MLDRFGRNNFLCLAGALGLTFVGCSRSPYDQVAPVTGTVMCEGKPATGGTVIFRPVDASEKTGRNKGEPGQESRAMVGEDGRFTLIVEPTQNKKAAPGALVGPHQVFFQQPRTEPVAMHPEDKEKPLEQQKRIQAELDKVPIFKPLNCGDEISPNLVEVVAGQNEFNFTLGPKPKAEPPERRPARGPN